MDVKEAKSLMSEFRSLMNVMGGDGERAKKRWAELRPGGLIELSEAGRVIATAKRNEVVKAVLPDQPPLDREELEELVAAVEEDLGFTAFVRELVEKFHYMPNDSILAFIFDWLGHTAPSGNANFAAGRRNMKKQGWRFEWTQDKRGWNAMLDPNYGKRQALLKEAAELQADLQAERDRLAGLEQKQVELNRKLAEVGVAV